MLRAYFPDMNFDEPGVGWAEISACSCPGHGLRALVGIARILSQLRPDTPALVATGVPVHTCCTGIRTDLAARLVRRRPRTWARAGVIMIGAHSAWLRIPRQWAEFATGLMESGRWSGPCDAGWVTSSQNGPCDAYL